MKQLVCAATLLLFGMTTHGMAEVKFELKIPDGAKQTVHLETEMKQSLTIAGVEAETAVEMFQIQKSKAGKRDGEGKISVENEYEVMQAEITLPGGIKFQFDSGNPAGSEATNEISKIITDTMRVLAELKWTVVYGKDNRALEVKGTKEAREKVRNIFKSQFDPKRLKEEANKHLLAIPKKPVKKGDTWERESSTDFGSGQVFEFNMKFKYADVIEKDGKKLDKFAVSVTSVNYKVDPNQNDQGMTVEESKLKGDKSTGEVLFDRERGVVVSSKLDTKITGELKLNINGVSLPAKLDLSLTQKYTLQP